MKRLATALLAAALSWAAVPPAAAASTPPQKLAQVPILEVQIPAVFDSSSVAYVLAGGRFNNGCYHWIGAEVQQKPNFITEIRSYAAVSQGMCPQMIVPFHQQIQLGQLASGTYELHFVTSDGNYLEERLTIQ